MRDVELIEGEHLQLDNDQHKEGWMGVVAKIFKSVLDDMIEDFNDALVAYRETQDVLKFVDCPNNIVVDPFNIFGTLNLWGFMNNINFEAEMFNLERRSKQTESVEEKQQSTTQDREDTLRKFLGDLPLRGFDLNRVLECRDYNNELGQMLRELVGKVIVSALLEAVDVLLKYSWKWVENYDEKRMEIGVEMAGKVSRLIEKLVEIRCIREDEVAKRSGGT